MRIYIISTEQFLPHKLETPLWLGMATVQEKSNLCPHKNIGWTFHTIEASVMFLSTITLSQ